MNAVALEAVVETGRQEVEQGLETMLARLWRFALTQCGDHAVADDLVQSTCIRALERADQFESGSRLDSWLYSILISIWRNTTRANAVRRGAGLVEIADAHLESTAAEGESKVQVAQVLKAIAALPEGQSSVMLLVCVEGMSYAEAAQSLQIPIGTVMSRLSTARKAILALKSS
ncbi:MAG: RNA polymerase sigma factor [Pseudomonadota bacterium]